MIELKEKIMSVVFLLSALISILAVSLICLFLVINGVPAMREIGLTNFLLGREWSPTDIPALYGILPMILGSLYVTAGAVIIGVPVGILTAVFLARICPKHIYKFLKPCFELLAGIPSVVYGFFGMMVIVPFTGNSIMSAAILLGIMILPTITTVSESALRAVPEHYYEGSLALGAGRYRSIFLVVLPAAGSGVLASVILGVGRAVGETMAVIMVAGNQARMPVSLFKGVRTLTANIVIEMGYAADLHREALVATGVVLFLLILIINLSFSLFKMKDARSRSGKQLKKKRLLPSISLPSVPFLENGFNRLRLTLNKSLEKLLSYVTWGAAIITLGVLLFLIGFILVKGVPYIKPSLFSFTCTTENVSLMPALITTVIMAALALLIAVPLGVFAAVYLTEYARRGNKAVTLVRLTTETLSGIPSIVYGLFGLLFFVTFLGWRFSVLAGAFTLSIMILPLIMRSAEEALKAVPDTYREGSFGLGAGKLRTVIKIVLPAATPGILAGIILAIGRIVGETAALIYTAGTVAQIPTDPMQSARTLSVHLYALSGEGLHMNEGYATAVVLLLLVIVINFVSAGVAKRLFTT